MIATDLDGTLLGDARVIDERDWAGLAQLGRSGIVRVIATGRSLWSAQRVIPSELPIDYLVFSSGVGTVSWPDKKLIASHVMSDEVALTVAGKLAELGLDFMAQGPAPDSHRFVYWRSGVLDNPDFEHRLELYDSFATPTDKAKVHTTSHFVIVHPADEPDREFTRIRDMLLGLDVPLHIVRTTSPLDKKSLWIEVFPRGVSKANGCAAIAKTHGISVADTLAVGNDYNDCDMLDWAGTSYVVSNAPAPLKQQYSVTAANGEAGVSVCIAKWLGGREPSTLKPTSSGE